MKLIENAKDLNKEIGLIATAGKKLDQRIHVAACSCIFQADKHNNADPAIRLIAAMPKSGRTNALIEWFVTYGQFTWNEKKKTLQYNKEGKTQLDKAIAKPFWEFKPEPAYKPFDLQKEIARIIKKANERKEEIASAETPEEKEKAAANMIDEETLAKLQALVAG